MLARSPGFLFYPITLLWSLSYGAVAGVIYKLMAVYENWVAINRMQVRLWKKYPQRSYQQYISNLWAAQIRGTPVELAQYTREQLEKTYPAEPFPIMRLATNTVFMLFIAPFVALSGLVDGPLFVYRNALAARRRGFEQS